MRDGANVQASSLSLTDLDPGLKMLEFNVLVLPDEAEKRTKGGIILVDETAEADKHAKNTGMLVAVSPAAFNYDDEIRAVQPEVGVMVLYAKYGGTIVKGRDGRDYRVLKDKDIAAVIEPLPVEMREAA